MPGASRKRKIRAPHDLRVWRKAQKLSQRCRDICAAFPPAQASLAGLVCRLAEEVPHEIAAGQVTGQHAPYMDHLDRARRAVRRLERSLIDSHRLGCLAQEAGDPLLAQAADIDRMLRKLMVSLELAHAARVGKGGRAL